MAYRRCLLTRGNLIDRKFHPSFSYVLHSDEGKREQPDEKPSSAGIDIGNFFIQRRSFGSSLNGSMGFFAPSRDRFIPPFAGYNFCRNMSTGNQGSDNIEIMTDVADVLTETTMEAVASHAPIINEVAIAAADSFLPVKVLQYVIDAVHCYTGLNWWAAIALTTILIRSATLPLLINQLKATSKLTLLRPHLEEIKEEMDGKIMDPVAIAEGRKKMNKLLEEYGVSPFTPLKGLFIQGPIFVSFFLAITNMAEKMPSFKHGGAFWFMDLTTPDPLYIFPVLTALSFLVTVEFNMQEGMEGNPVAGTMKNVSRGLAVLTVPFTAGFEKAIFCYWVTSNLFSLMYGLVLKVPGVKKTLGIPAMPAAEPGSSPQSPFSIFPDDDLGVVKKVVREGQGWESPREPYEVKAWISANTVAGKLIMSHTEGEPYFFTFGKSEVPKGLEMGIGTMAREEKAVIYVTSQYLTESPLMPVIQDDEVQFEVELVHFIQVRDMLGDGRLIKRRIRDGKGEFPMDCPLHDSLLRVHYKGTVLNEEKRVFYDTRVDNDGQPLEFCSGEGLVPEGFEMSVRLMLPGEIALVTCPPDYAYDKFPRPLNVPEGAHIQWEIELLAFETPKDWTGLDFKSIMNDAENIRNTGNRLFKEGKYELAKAKYEKVLREFNHVHPHDDEEGKVFADTRNLLHLNVAACYLKLGECRKSIETCNKVLEANPAHVKGLYRRGMAYMAAGDFEEARSDFNMMMKVDKSAESDATAALSKLKQKEQEVEKKARKQFKGLFDKKPGEIAEAKAIEDGDQITSESQKDDEVHGGDSSDGTSSEDTHEEAAPDAHRMGWFSHFWPTGSRFFSSLGLQRCAIL